MTSKLNANYCWQWTVDTNAVALLAMQLLTPVKLPTPALTWQLLTTRFDVSRFANRESRADPASPVNRNCVWGSAWQRRAVVNTLSCIKGLHLATPTGQRFALTSTCVTSCRHSRSDIAAAVLRGEIVLHRLAKSQPCTYAASPSAPALN